MLKTNVLMVEEKVRERTWLVEPHRRWRFRAAWRAATEHAPRCHRARTPGKKGQVPGSWELGAEQEGSSEGEWGRGRRREAERAALTAPRVGGVIPAVDRLSGGPW